MASTSLFRLATRAVRPSTFVRAPQVSRVRVQQTPIALAINRPSFSTTSMRLSGAHEDETYEEFSSRYAVTDYFWEAIGGLLERWDVSGLGGGTRVNRG